MFLGTVVGIGTAFLTVWLMQLIGHMAFPPPADLDVEDIEAFREYVNTLPVGALAFVLASYLIGTFDGVFLACLIARMKYHIFAIIVGGLMLVATISNLIMIPHPLWFSAASLLGIAAMAVLAAYLAHRTLPRRPE